MSKLIIVSNRLPMSISKQKNTLQVKPSVGGLATGLGAFYKEYESCWVGWPGLTDEQLGPGDREEILEKCRESDCHPVFLTEQDMDGFYYGFSNKTIWPLFHYFTLYAVYQPAYWEAYKKVNQMFSDEIGKILEPGDTLWIHDYQLMLLPQMVREKVNDVSIGFFLHIPFPSFEIFRLFPWRSEILDGILGSDLIGFHTYDYVRHFFSCVRRIRGLEHTFGQLSLENRLARVDAFPMGIDYERFADASKDSEVQSEMNRILKRIGDRQTIISVDRLDYSKGISNRLEIFDRFLDRYPSYKGNVSMILVAVPSRTGIDNYMLLKKELDELVGRVNGKHGSIGWQPVLYLYRSLPFHSLVGLYCAADVAMVTPYRDGMNLIAKEYMASKTDGNGVLILSETAGAANELGEAIMVNPNNEEEMIESLKLALTMPDEERRERNRVMQNRLKRYNVTRWASDFMDRLRFIKQQQQNLNSRKLSPAISQKLMEDLKQSQRRLILLDYDGTLIPFADKPGKAEPDSSLLQTLKALAQNPKNQVVIISGRNKEFLEYWFGRLPIGMIAEHGVWIRKPEGNWELVEPIRGDWKEEIRPILEQYVDSTPKSFLEEKDYSLVWHYRQSQPELAQIRACELKDAIINLTENLNLGILEGSKVLEIKNTGVNKGATTVKWLATDEWDFVFAVGDDVTDEDIFAVLPDQAYSLKVGYGLSKANYNVDSYMEVREIIKEMAKDTYDEAN